jgi:23S rRNA (uracil1939-C5)-methyltransferase
MWHVSFKGAPVTEELHEVTFSGLTYGGDALGHLEDGRAVFVPFVLPGERVRVRLLEDKGRFARGEMMEMLRSAPERIEARCKHFGACGGCHYQHLPYEHQLTAKAAILRDQLAHVGGIKAPPLEPTVASPSPWHYRNQVQFHLASNGRLGYMGTRRRGPTRKVVPIDECHLPEPAIDSLWPEMDFEGHAGIERISIRAGSDGDLLAVLESNSPNEPLLEIEASVSVLHMFDGDTVVIAGEDHVTLRVMDRDFRVTPPAFFQVNTAVAEMMVQHVLDLMPAEAGVVVDAYCGGGLFSAFLAARCRRLIGIESLPAACEDFSFNLDEYENVELYTDTVERVLPLLEAKPSMLVVDPPRAGLEHGALEAIVKMEPGLLVYISCDPATLARDAGRLISAGWRLDRVRPFDLFPQTYHIESISTFKI